MPVANAWRSCQSAIVSQHRKKFEIRNPKFETNSKFKKSNHRGTDSTEKNWTFFSVLSVPLRLRSSSLEFRILDLFRIASFGLRVSDFEFRVWVAYDQPLSKPGVSGLRSQQLGHGRSECLASR